MADQPAIGPCSRASSSPTDAPRALVHGHRGPRPLERRHAPVHRQERRLQRVVAGRGYRRRARPVRQSASLHVAGDPTSTRFPFPSPRRCSSGPAALRHLLLHVPRPHRQRRRHDRAARLHAAALVPHAQAAQARGGYYFQVITNGYGAMPDYSAPDQAEGPLGDHRLCPRPAAEPERDLEDVPGGRKDSSCRGRQP